LTRLEEGDGPDSRVPPVSGRSEKKKGEGRCWAGGCAELGHWAGLLARERKEKEGLLAWKGLRAKRIGERERERERRVLSFFSNFFQIHFSNIQTPIK
jgi:hypothetical protein